MCDVKGHAGRNYADRGATAVEYAVLISLIAALIIGAVIVFRTEVIDLFAGTAEGIEDASGP